MARAVRADPEQKLMSLAQWAELDEDVEGELVDGVLEDEEMATILHEIAVVWLIRVLSTWARHRRGYVTGSEAKIAVGPRRGRKPDLAVHLGAKRPALADTLVRVPPHIVVEVISPRPSDARRDRVAKMRDYACAGIAYYWLLDPQLRVLEVLELEVRSRYRVALSRSAGKGRVPGCPGLVLDLDDLWAEIADADARSRRTKRARR
jgi:Uma2 family endonuclease